jgi:hypothetical protein
MKQRLVRRGRNPSRFVSFFFLIVCFVGEYFGWSRAAFQETNHEDDLKNQFQQEAPKRWEEYAQKVAQFQGRFSFQLTQELKKLKAKDVWELKKGNRGRELLLLTSEWTSEDKPPRKTFEVYGLNPRYGFVLRRESPSSPWLLIGLAGPQADSLSEFKSKHFDKVVDSYVNDLVRVHRDRLIDIVQQPEFRVIRTRRVQRLGEELAEVTFDCPREVKARGNPVQGGTLVLDPRRFWCIRSYDVRTKTASGRGHLKFQVVNWEEVDGLPVPRHAVLHTESTNDGHKNKQKWQFEYDLSVPDRLSPDGDFTLSAFGLPEPEGLGRGRGIRWYLWAGVLGVVCLSLAVLLRWRARRVEQVKQ